MKSEKRLVLAIETAICGGSISISDGKTEIDCWIGNQEISKAEDVLENIHLLLKKNGLTKKDMQMVAVSAEPGSATGLKIGLATAKGLAKAFDCELTTFSLMPSLYASVNESLHVETIFAVPVGKKNICYQSFLKPATKSATVTVSQETFYEFLQNNHNNGRIRIFAHQEIIDSLLSSHPDGEWRNIMASLGGNMARFIGLPYCIRV